jgi:hypothetical protein
VQRLGTDPDDHLRSFPDDVRDDMVALDAMIVAAMPERRRDVWQGTFWGGTEQTIIGYGDLVQPRPRGLEVEWFIVGLARQRRHLSVYVNAVRDNAYLLGGFADRLGKVKVGAASISFRRLADLDRDGFTELVALSHEVCPPDR